MRRTRFSLLELIDEALEKEVVELGVGAGIRIIHSKAVTTGRRGHTLPGFQGGGNTETPPWGPSFYIQRRGSL